VLRFLSGGCAGLALAVIVASCGGAVQAGSGPGADGGDAGDDAVDASDELIPGIDGAFPDVGTLDGSDGALPACDQGVCPSPASVSGFAPTWKPPTGAHQNACTTALIDEYYTDCLAEGGTQDCSAFDTDAAHEACQSCLVSNFTDPQWAALVYGEGEIETNTSGCIALLDPAAIDCAMAVQAEDQCQHAACDAICGAGNASGFDDWVTCSAAANGCDCGSWFQGADCVKSLAGAQNPAAPCLVGQTFQDYYYSVAAVFCGP
jgi:hypothetical protein